MYDFSTIGEVLLKAVNEANLFFKTAELKHRFNNDPKAFVEDVFDMMIAKKKNGKPKDDYPPFEMTQTIKEANVKNNRFSVLFSEKALIEAGQEQVLEKREVADHAASQISNSTDISPHNSYSTVSGDAYAGRGICAPSPKNVQQAVQ